MSVDFPQRIIPVARPGLLLKRANDLREVIDAERGDGNHTANIQACPCLHCGMDPCGEAAHLRAASGAHGKASGMGKKPDIRWLLPLCGEHHRLARDAQHNRSERAFWAELGIDPFLTAERLWGRRGDLVAMRAVVYVAIAEREALSQQAGIARLMRRPA